MRFFQCLALLIVSKQQDRLAIQARDSDFKSLGCDEHVSFAGTDVFKFLGGGKHVARWKRRKANGENVI